MLFRRNAWIALAISLVLILGACGSGPANDGPAAPDPGVTVTTVASGGVTGFVQQVDKAKDVAGKVDEHNQLLEELAP